MTTGSSYEVYDKTHLSYDKTRLPVGNEQVAAFILQNHGSTARILDVGCGTGSHLEGLHNAGLTNLVGLDASATGLAQARGKLARLLPEANTSPRLVCADMRSMPFADQSFDVLLFSFVLHHLPHASSRQLEEATQTVLQEAERLLTPGGHVIIITCSQEQLSADQGCLWYYKYFPEAAARLAARFLDKNRLQELADTAKLSALTETAVERTYWTESSLDVNGPLDETWRNGDSLFALAAQNKELFAAQIEALKADIASGEVHKHVQTVRSRSEQIKQAILLTARKV